MTKYSNITPGDLLVHEESAIRCREAIAVINPNASEFFAPVGTPIKADGTICVALDQGDAVGLTLEAVTIAGSGTTASKIPYIARDAAINEAKILATDPNGAAYTIATIVAALAAFGIISRQEPTKRSVQIN